MPHAFIPSSDGTLIAVQDWGPKEGKTILFLHGFLHNSSVWYNQIASPASRPFRLVTMDIRGHGFSGKPATPAGYTDPALFDDDINAVIRGLGLKKPVLAGWSMGGIMAMFYLQKYGQSQLGGLALIDSAACPDVPCLLRQFASGQQNPSFGMLVSPDAQTAFDGIQRFVNLEASGSESTPGPLKPEQALILQTAMITVPQFARLGVQIGLANTNLIFASLMSTVTIPVLIQHGGNDALIDPAVVATEQTLFRNLTVKLYPQGGHIPFIMVADEVSRDLSRWMITSVR